MTKGEEVLPGPPVLVGSVAWNLQRDHWTFHDEKRHEMKKRIFLSKVLKAIGTTKTVRGDYPFSRQGIEKVTINPAKWTSWHGDQDCPCIGRQ